LDADLRRKGGSGQTQGLRLDLRKSAFSDFSAFEGFSVPENLWQQLDAEKAEFSQINQKP
jgi:hypothetical protein